MVDIYANIASLVTTVIVFIWFLFNRFHHLAHEYYSELVGLFAGFVPVVKVEKDFTTYSGMILKVNNVSPDGYMRGEFELREKNRHGQFVIDGLWTFYGSVSKRSLISRMVAFLSLFKSRNPLLPRKNRVYKGVLYVINRFDHEEINYNIDQHVSAKYSFTHYREMGRLDFVKIESKRYHGTLPNKFSLHKSMGFQFEPYALVSRVIFDNEPKLK